MNTTFLSTGKAAKMRSVTPDTILKWIKSGKIKAQRTAGGHYRINEEEFESFLAGIQTSSKQREQSSQASRIPFCWEYNNERDVSEGCRECFVYRTRAERCYEVARVTKKIGHKKLYCKTSCQDCEYFQKVREKAAGILLVTNDTAFAASLKHEATLSPCRLEIADCGYSFSYLLEGFRPDFIVIDNSLGMEAVLHLGRHALEDPRIPDVRVILAGKKGEFADTGDKNLFAQIEKPFNLGDLAGCL